jgi:membrane associated rhomboid family serine protease
MTDQVVCYRHPDRVAGVRCQRCERAICPACMRQASVGFQCPDCVAARPQKVVTSRHLFKGHDEVVVGKVIIAVNVAAWLLMTVLSRDPYRAVLSEHGVVRTVGRAGGAVTSSAVPSRTPVFHLGMNMLLLWFLSQELEPALGRLRFAVLYVVSLLGGALGVMVLDPLAPTVGASGAVFGLRGALIVLQLRAKQNPWQSGIGGLVAINLVLTFLIPGISIGGPLGGLVAGAAAGALLQPRAGPRRAPLRTTVVVGLGATFLVAALRPQPPSRASTAVAAAGGRRPRPRPAGLSARTARPGSAGWCARRGAGPVVPRRRRSDPRSTTGTSAARSTRSASDPCAGAPDPTAPGSA